MQLALKMSDLSLAIAHLKQSVRIEYNKDEDEFLGELILQKGLTDIQISGKHFPGTSVRIRGDIANFTPKYYEAVAYLMGDRRRDALRVIDEMIKEKGNNIEAHVLKGNFPA